MIKDPDETTNLFNDPAHDSLKRQLMDYIACRPDDAGSIRTQVGMD